MCKFSFFEPKNNKRLVSVPIIEEIFDKLGNGWVEKMLFPYWNQQKSKKHASFVTDNPQCEFNKVPFGLSTSPTIF